MSVRPALRGPRARFLRRPGYLHGKGQYGFAGHLLTVGHALLELKRMGYRDIAHQGFEGHWQLVPPDQSVYTQRMVLRYARVNDVPDSIFTKEGYQANAK